MTPTGWTNLLVAMAALDGAIYLVWEGHPELGGALMFGLWVVAVAGEIKQV